MRFIATEQPSANPEWLAAFKESVWRNRITRNADLLTYPLTGYIHTLAYAHFILQYKEEVHLAPQLPPHLASTAPPPPRAAPARSPLLSLSQLAAQLRTQDLTRARLHAPSGNRSPRRG